MKELLLGTSDFKKIIINNGYFVDKTLLIKDVIDSGSEVTLIPRPRRFGKTINMSMLHYFFEKPLDNTLDNSSLFEKLKIGKENRKYLDHLGKYPVIFLSFKDAKESTWAECLENIASIIGKEYSRHNYVLEKEYLSGKEKRYFLSIENEEASKTQLGKSLAYLTEFLHKYHKKSVMLLIDEYDMPLTTGYSKGYYEDIRDLMRNLLSGGLKDNDYLEKGILTGILRVAKESIFSGLNNPSVCTILDKAYSSYFGFTEEEVTELLHYYKVKTPAEKVRQWYNGYTFGETVIYNPWSIVEFIRTGVLDSYWVNTSSNDIIHSLVTNARAGVKKDLELLMKNGSIEKVVDKSIIYSDVGRKEKALWNFFLFSGYLKAENVRLVRTRKIADFTIPNLEVFGLFEDIILEWLDVNSGDTEITDTLRVALTEGDYQLFEDIFIKYVEEAFSYFDVGGDKAEDFYHAFVLGIMVTFRDVYDVKSNRESGYGRYDVMLIPKDKDNHCGIVFEFKRKRPSETLEEALASGMKQIKDNNYKQELLSLGVKNIREIAIAFEGKKCIMEGE